MNPLEAAVLIAVISLPAWWLVQRELDKLDDPAYLRDHGVVIVAETALQAHSAPIGTYLGHPIWGSLTFKGMRYRFDRVISRKKKEQIGKGELYLDPGLVYVTD